MADHCVVGYARAMSGSTGIVVDIIKKLTNQRKRNPSTSIFDVPEDIYKLVKKTIKINAKCVDELYRLIAVNLDNKSGSVRVRILKLCDYLVPRCRQFRTLFLSDIREIIKKTGTVRVFGKCPAKTHHEQLEAFLFRAVSCWDADYGIQFPALRALIRYMRESLRLAVPDVNEERRALRNEANLQLAEKIALGKVRLRQTFQRMDEEWLEIAGNLDKLEEAFRVMFPDISSGTADALFSSASVVVASTGGHAAGTMTAAGVEWLSQHMYDCMYTQSMYGGKGRGVMIALFVCQQRTETATGRTGSSRPVVRSSH